MDAFVSLLERVTGADKATLRTKEDVLCCMPRPEACEGGWAELPRRRSLLRRAGRRTGDREQMRCEKLQMEGSGSVQ